MPDNRIFVSGALLDRWVTVGQVELGDGFVKVTATGERYALEEAARIVQEATATGDAQGLVGHVRTHEDLGKLGAEVLDRSLLIGEVAYDVVPGFLASPEGNAGMKVPSSRVLQRLTELSEESRGPKSDEELLARFLIEKL